MKLYSILKKMIVLIENEKYVILREAGSGIKGYY